MSLWQRTQIQEVLPEHYGLRANCAGTYLAWFRAVRKKYAHVWDAFSLTMKAAERQGSAEATRQRTRILIAGETFGEGFVREILGHELGLPVGLSLNNVLAKRVPAVCAPVSARYPARGCPGSVLS